VFEFEVLLSAEQALTFLSRFEVMLLGEAGVL
jgi:hypothetical protein